MKILLCIYVCLVVLPSFKAAAEVSGDWEYSVSGGEAIINNYTGPGGGLVIPETLAGLPVKEIGALALSEKGITSLTIPDTIIRLGDNAFSANPGLSYVSISSNITNLPTGVFASSGLSSFLIPNSVVKIGAGAFYECTNLTGITIPGSVIEIEPYAFLDCRGLTNVVFEGSPMVGNSSFQGTPYGDLNPILDGLGYVPLDGQTNGPFALVFNFQSNSATNIIVPAEVYGRPVTEIKSHRYRPELGEPAVVHYPFRSTTKSVQIPATITNIQLGRWIQPGSPLHPTNWGSDSFIRFQVDQDNPAFTSEQDVLYTKDRSLVQHAPIPLSSFASFSGDWEFVPSWANWSAIITRYTGVADGGFIDISIPSEISFYSYSIPIKEIGPFALAGVSRRFNLQIPYSNLHSGITNIAEGAFAASGINNSFSVPGYKIGYRAFYSCSNLWAVTIGGNQIATEAFKKCTNLGGVTFNSRPIIGSGAFSETLYQSYNPIVDGFGYLSLDGQTNGPLSLVYNFHESSQTNLVVPTIVSGRPVTQIGTSTSYPYTHWTQFFFGQVVSPLRTNHTSLFISENITNIESKFWMDSNLQQVDVAEANQAFMTDQGAALYGRNKQRVILYLKNKTNLSHYSILAGTESIEDNAFEYSKLSSIGVPSSVTHIGNSAFRQSWITNISIPNGVTNIAASTFQDCTNLINVSLPTNLTTIQSQAFRGCSKLETIALPESMVGSWNNYQSLASDSFKETPIKSASIPYALLVHPGAMAGLTNNFPLVTLGSASQTRDLYVNSIANALVGVLATNQVFISNLAQAILAASNNYGLATKTEVGAAVNVGVRRVLSAPSDYNLFTPIQVESERTEGQNDVLNDPNNYSLYTTNQIQNLGLGGIVLNRNTNNQLVLNYEILQSNDLQNWAPYQQNELVISNAPADKLFLRVQAVR